MEKGIGDQYQEATKYSRDSLVSFRMPTADRAEPFKSYPDAVQSFPLTMPATRHGFWDIICKRRSHRDFADTLLSMHDLSLLLFACQGITAKEHGYFLRTAPSAGALYPIETYLLVNRVETLSRGIYHLNITRYCLELIHEGSFELQLAHAALDQAMVADSAITFIWTAVVNRSKWKYQERAYRYIYMDAGHIGQNLYLAATALGIGCCTIGAFYDDEVNNLLGIDGITETAVYLASIGHI